MVRTAWSNRQVVEHDGRRYYRWSLPSGATLEQEIVEPGPPVPDRIDDVIARLARIEAAVKPAAAGSGTGFIDGVRRMIQRRSSGRTRGGEEK